ncbi:pectin lyase fold/virulence factor [Poronia punctata]|nr:pectin lyase fold/virulence factor [Poronia punctata]
MLFPKNWAVLILAGLISPVITTTTTLYMSPSGSDSNSGSSVSAALKTLKGVQARLVATKPTDAIDVVIAEGTYLSQSVIWTYFTGQPITFSPPASGSTKPVFDGQGEGLTWFTMSDSSVVTNLRFVGLAVTNYWLALDLGRDKEQGNSGNVVRDMLFERIGAMYTHNLPDPKGYAALRMRRSRNNTVTGNRFHGVKNGEEFTGYIHAIYLAHESTFNEISGNEFNQVTGDAVRTRDGSGDNLIRGNMFIKAGKYSAYSDWIDDEGEECPSRGNRFVDNTVGEGYFGGFEMGFVTHVYGPDGRCADQGDERERILESGTVLI